MKVNTEEAKVLSLTGQVFEVIFRLGIVLLLIAFAIKTVMPFVSVVLAGAILAVALYPPFCKLSAKLGGRQKIVGTLFILISIGVILVPSIKLAANSIQEVQVLAEAWEKGEINVNPPNDKVKEWPVVGEKVHKVWTDASRDLEATAQKFKPQIKAAGEKLVGALASGAGTLLGVVFILIVTGVLMINGESGANFTYSFCDRLLGKSGKAFADLTAGTIRSVAVGVVGTAFIQATLAAIGMLVMGIPLAAVWTFLVFMVALMQLPPILVLGPIAAFAFSSHSGTAATIFLVWCLFVSFADGILKPILLGRGVDVPMLVILLGALGGMMSMGMMGLFVGAVVVSVIYRLFVAWLNEEAVINADPFEEGDSPGDESGGEEAGAPA